MKRNNKISKRKKPKKDVRRMEILDAAARCFSKQGYSGTSMRDIAKYTNILPGSLYYHFKSKEELYFEVHTEGIRRILDRL